MYSRTSGLIEFVLDLDWYSFIKSTIELTDHVTAEILAVFFPLNSFYLMNFYSHFPAPQNITSKTKLKKNFKKFKKKIRGSRATYKYSLG